MLLLAIERRVEVDYECPPVSGTRGVSDGDTVSAQPSRKVGGVRVLSVVNCREHLGGSWPARSMAGGSCQLSLAAGLKVDRWTVFHRDRHQRLVERSTVVLQSTRS